MIAKRLFSSASYQFLSWTIGVVVAFLMTPKMISTLGKEAYGLWILVAAVFSFYGVLDFGLAVSTQRSIAQAVARDDEDDACSTVSTSFFVFLLIGLVALLATIVIVALAEHIVSNKDMLSDFRWAAVFLGASLSAIFPSYAFSAVYSAHFRTDISSRIHLVKMLARSSAIWLLLLFKLGVAAIAAITAITDILAAMVMVFFAVRLAPWCRIRIRKFQRKKFLEMLDFGAAYMVTVLCTRFRSSLAAVVVSKSKGLESVAQFSICQQFVDYFSRFIGPTVGVAQPLFTRQQSSGRHSENSRDLQILIEISMAISVIAGTCILASAPPFVSQWLGHSFQFDPLPLFVLVLGAIYSLGTSPLEQVLYAYGHQRRVALLNTIELLVIALGIWPLSSLFGLTGTAVSVTLPGTILRTLVMPGLVEKCLPLNKLQYALLMGRSALVIIVTVASVSALREVLPWGGYINVVVTAVASVIISGAFALFLCIGGQSRSALRRLVAKYVPA